MQSQTVLWVYRRLAHLIAVDETYSYLFGTEIFPAGYLLLKYGTLYIILADITFAMCSHIDMHSLSGGQRLALSKWEGSDWPFHNVLDGGGFIQNV